MTPENQNTSLEQQAEKPRVAAANEVIARAKEQHPALSSNFEILDKHVDALLEAADNEEITGSAGVYTREQMLDQFKSFLEDLNKKPQSGEKPTDPFLRIPGKDGLRDSFKLLMNNEATWRSLQESLRLHIEAHETKRAELLSPENIQEMGEAELVAAEVPEPLQEARRAASGLIEMPDFIKNPQVVQTPAEVVTEPQPVVEQEPKPETELEMNERFLRQTQAELQDLYAQHRQAVPNSWEAGSLENQIKNAKEDAGAFARKVAKLKGQNWT